MKADAQSFVLHCGELAHKHLGSGGVHQVVVALGDGRRRLCQHHGGLQLEGGGRREELGGLHHVIQQPLILLL